MSSDTGSTSRGFGGRDWADLISGATQGFNTAMGSMANQAQSKREIKEMKRRTLADMLSRAMKRDMALYRSGQEYSDEMNDTGTNALQQVARGFVEAMKGSTRRG